MEYQNIKPTLLLAQPFFITAETAIGIMSFKAYLHYFSLKENATIHKSMVGIALLLPFFKGFKLSYLIRMRARCLHEGLQMLSYHFMTVENVTVLYLMNLFYIF